MLQSNQVFSFFQASERGDWSQRKLADFYRLEDARQNPELGFQETVGSPTRASPGLFSSGKTTKR